MCIHVDFKQQLKVSGSRSQNVFTYYAKIMHFILAAVKPAENGAVLWALKFMPRSRLTVNFSQEHRHSMEEWLIPRSPF